MQPAAQHAALKEHRLDLCFYRLGPSAPELTSEPLSSEAIAIVLPQQHRLARRARVALKDLADERFISFKLDQSRFAAYLYQSCIEAGFTPHIYQQVVEVQRLLPASTGRFGHAGVVYRPLTQPAPDTTLYATYRKDDPSPVLRVFLAIMRELIEAPAP